MHKHITGVITNETDLKDIKERTKMILQNMQVENPRLYKQFYYHNDVFHYISNITRAIERIEMTPIFIRRFPRNRTYDNRGITLHRWIQYHYSNYLVTVVSLYDTALLLTNAVFALRVEPKKCNDRTITNNAIVKQTPVKGTLEAISSAVDKYRDTRNYLVHRNIQPELERLDELESFRFVYEAGKSFNQDWEPIIHPNVVKFLYSHHRRALIKEVIDETEKLTDALYDFFTELGFVYEVITEHFAEKS
jgi:hypothetical protein